MVTKQQDKPLSLLEKAREELAAFNRKQLSVPGAAPTPNTRITTREPSHGERVLHCSKVPQASAVLILKLHEKGAEITEVIARRNAPVSPQGGTQAVHNDLDMRALLLGNYQGCLLYTSPSPRDRTRSRMPSSA
jgi:S-adenosylhomocysteine hydrolase